MSHRRLEASPEVTGSQKATASDTWLIPTLLSLPVADGMVAHWVLSLPRGHEVVTQQILPSAAMFLGEPRTN